MRPKHHQVFVCAPLSLSWANQNSPGCKGVVTVVQAVQVMPHSALGTAKDIRFQPYPYEPFTTSRVPAFISIVHNQFSTQGLEINGSLMAQHHESLSPGAEWGEDRDGREQRFSSQSHLFFPCSPRAPSCSTLPMATTVLADMHA